MPDFYDTDVSVQGLCGTSQQTFRAPPGTSPGVGGRQADPRPPPDSRHTARRPTGQNSPSEGTRTPAPAPHQSTQALRGRGRRAPRAPWDPGVGVTGREGQTPAATRRRAPSHQPDSGLAVSIHQVAPASWYG